MNWISLQSDSQLDEIVRNSDLKPQIIFKHSTRCSISAMIKNRLEKSNQPENADFFYLDLIRFRSISNRIADDFHVRHESPQVIIIKDGKPVYHESHSSIYMEDIIENMA